MNEAEQELYEALVAICQTSGFLLLEELPTDLPDQPFVYLGDSKNYLSQLNQLFWEKLN